MNARPQCLDSFVADAHVQRLSDDDAASDFWAVQADREIRVGMRLNKPADWFETRISGPRGGWSPDELLLHALDCDNEPVRSVFARLMVGQASAAELHTALVDFALEHCSEGVAAALEQEARNGRAPPGRGRVRDRATAGQQRRAAGIPARPAGPA